jgi:hypothetical protein
LLNVNASVDCARVIDDEDGSHDIILSGTINAGEFGSLVPPGASEFNLVNNQYYGCVNIDRQGVLSRSNFPCEYEGCALNGQEGEPVHAVLPPGFPTTNCNAQNFANFDWITCQQLQGKSLSELETFYGLAIDRTMDAGITRFSNSVIWNPIRSLPKVAGPSSR